MAVRTKRVVSSGHEWDEPDAYAISADKFDAMYESDE